MTEAYAFSTAFRLSVLLLPRLVVLVGGLALFDIRSKAGYLAVALAALAVCMMCPGAALSGFDFFAGTLAAAVPVLIFAKDKPSRKAFTAVVYLVAVSLAEVPARIIWADFSGDLDQIDAWNFAECLEYGLLAGIVHACILVVLLVGVYVAQARITRNRTDRAVFCFIWFMAMQLALVVLSLVVVELLGGFNRATAAGSAAISVVFLLTDVVFFFLMSRYNRAARSMQQAEALQDELARYLERYGEIEREIAATARLRHDLRNQAAVILLLLERGDVARARRYVGALISHVLAAIVEAQGGACASTMAPSAGLQADEGVREAAASAKAENVAWGGVSMKAEPSYGFLFRPACVLFPASQLVALAFMFLSAIGTEHFFAVLAVCVVAAALCAAADIVLFRALLAARERDLIDERIRLLEEQKVLQQSYYERLRADLATAKGVRTKVVSMLCELDDLLERGEAREASALLGQVVEMTASIDAMYCQNHVVNALLAMKAGVCEEEGIRLECNLLVPGSLPISDVDLCAVLSNLMDNGIAGCREAAPDKRSITLKACVVSGVLVVDMVNGCAPGRRAAKGEAAACEESLLREHGWGLHILRSLAKRHNGAFEAGRADEEWFHTTVMMMLDNA